MTALTIGKLAAQGGVGVETVRYYQRRGLLGTPPRAGDGINGGVRRYGEDDLRRLKFIRAAQAAGFTLDQIRALLAFDATDDRAEARALAERQIAVLDAKLAELTAARASLERLARDCRHGAAGACPILRAFDQG
jgi:MerR family mercuric resistance operon transcriptional regulator